jgi:hypothetical protein
MTTISAPITSADQNPLGHHEVQMGELVPRLAKIPGEIGKHAVDTGGQPAFSLLDDSPSGSSWKSLAHGSVLMDDPNCWQRVTLPAPPALDAELIPLHPATGRRRLLGWPSASPCQRQPAIVLRPGAAPCAARAADRGRARGDTHRDPVGQHPMRRPGSPQPEPGSFPTDPPTRYPRQHEHTTTISGRTAHDPRQHALQRRAVARRDVLAVSPPGDHEWVPVAC